MIRMMKDYGNDVSTSLIVYHVYKHVYMKIYNLCVIIVI
jgi:hypothetical protein